MLIYTFLLCSTAVHHLEVRLQEVDFRIQNLQDEYRSEYRSTHISQQQVMERLFAQLRGLQQSQVHAHQTLLGEGINSMRDNASQSSGHQDRLQTSRQLENSSGTMLSSPENHQSRIIGLKIRQSASSTCRRNCSCQCHMRQNWRSYQFLDQFLGGLFVGYSHAPKATLSCDSLLCGRHHRTITIISYVFPYWFVWRIWSIMLLYTARDGLEASFRIIRAWRVSDLVFLYAATGDMVKLKGLFDRGEASPFDVGAESGICVLGVGTIWYSI